MPTTAPAQTPVADPEIERLRNFLSGSFSSAAQAAEDPERYFDIRLEMHPIWTDRADGVWLYIEQAAADKRDKPYRQRVYRITRHGDGRLQSAVYTLPGDPLDYVSVWQHPERLATLTPEDLTLRAGCATMLAPQGTTAFAGSTEGKGCASRVSGASYATVEVVITENQFRSWDRGFNANDEQVWGAVAGPYVFIKQR